MDELYHAGKIGRSGRYKWGEGKQPFQRFQRDGSRSGIRMLTKQQLRMRKNASKVSIRRNEMRMDKAESDIKRLDKEFAISLKTAKKAGILNAGSLAAMAMAYGDIGGLSAAALVMGSTGFITTGIVAAGSIAVAGALKISSNLKINEISNREIRNEKLVGRLMEIEEKESKFERGE